MDAKQEKRINATIQLLTQQRDSALNSLVQTQVELAMLKEELDDVRKSTPAPVQTFEHPTVE